MTLTNYQAAWEATVHRDPKAYCQVEDTFWELPIFFRDLGESVFVGVTRYFRDPVNAFRKEYADEDFSKGRFFAGGFSLVTELALVEAAHLAGLTDVPEFYRSFIMPLRLWQAIISPIAKEEPDHDQ